MPDLTPDDIKAIAIEYQNLKNCKFKDFPAENNYKFERLPDVLVELREIKNLLKQLKQLVDQNSKV